MVNFKEDRTKVASYASAAWSALCRWIKRGWSIVRRPQDITNYALILSIFTLFVYNIPLISNVVNSVDADFNGFIIVTTVFILLIVLNYFLYYLLLYCFRVVGKYLIAFTFIGNAICLYFINSYNTLITMEMMGNVFNTRPSEAGSYMSTSFVLYVIFLGIIPAICVAASRINYRSIWRFLTTLVVTVAILISSFFINRDNILWIDRYAPFIGGLAMPYCYTVNSIRYLHKWIMMNRKAIPLPDATIETDTRDVVVLVIGESARRDHFSLYGYERETNPYLEQEEDLVAIDAISADTYTTAGVKAIIDHKPVDELYEILPNYLHRTGVDVIWRTSNWGEPPLKFDKYYDMEALRARYNTDSEYDELLVHNLAEDIMAGDKQKSLVVLHTSTSHGPTYFKKYPYEFEEFFPVCTEVEMSKANRQHLINAYDNTILYTDYILHLVIEELRSLPEGTRCCMIYVSDHGESLGENNVYMHGLPKDMAPEQCIIPFIVWDSDPYTHVKDLKSVEQYHTFHSVLSFLGISSPIFNEDRNIFYYEERPTLQGEQIEEMIEE
jgi:lipid A ethanolaminephosphotransferase